MDQRLKEGCYGRVFPTEKMYTFLKGKFSAIPGDQEALRALEYMKKRHEGQFRKDGQPYIVHPLWMACYAAGLESVHITDTTFATILLHDVCEETDAMVEELPFSEPVRRGVKYMTLTRFKDETPLETKRRYMNELLESKDATICKPIDRYINLSTMSGSFLVEKIIKNVKETDQLLLPVLDQAKHKWPEMSGLLFVLRANVRLANDNLAMALGVKLQDENFVNGEFMRDFA